MIICFVSEILSAVFDEFRKFQARVYGGSRRCGAAERLQSRLQLNTGTVAEAFQRAVDGFAVRTDELPVITHIGRKVLRRVFVELKDPHALHQAVAVLPETGKLALPQQNAVHRAGEVVQVVAKKAARMSPVFFQLSNWPLL